MKTSTYHHNQYKQQQEQHTASRRDNKDKPEINNQFVSGSNVFKISKR